MESRKVFFLTTVLTLGICFQVIGSEISKNGWNNIARINSFQKEDSIFTLNRKSSNIQNEMKKNKKERKVIKEKLNNISDIPFISDDDLELSKRTFNTLNSINILKIAEENEKNIEEKEKIRKKYEKEMIILEKNYKKLKKIKKKNLLRRENVKKNIEPEKPVNRRYQMSTCKINEIIKEENKKEFLVKEERRKMQLENEKIENEKKKWKTSIVVIKNNENNSFFNRALLKISRFLKF